MKEKNVIYLTKEQLKEIYEFQTEKDKPKFLEYLKDKDIEHIDVIKFVESSMFRSPDSVLDTYGEFLTMLEKKEYEERTGREWNPFRDALENSPFTKEQIAEIQRINTMTEAELDEYIKDVKVCESNPNDLKGKVVWY